MDKNFNGYAYSTAHKDVQDLSGQSAGLRHQTIEVFRILQEHEGQVISRDELINQVWPGKVATDDSVTQCISEIRKVLGDKNKAVVQTIPKKGYRLVAPQKQQKKMAQAKAILYRQRIRELSHN